MQIWWRTIAEHGPWGLRTGGTFNICPGLIEIEVAMELRHARISNSFCFASARSAKPLNSPNLI